MSITKETRTVAPCPYGDGYGMTLREYFAGLAMQGMGTWIPPADFGPFNFDSREEVCALKARWAIAQADALLAALEPTP